jgi:hypothetical protein
MDFSSVPEGSGLPSLPIPSQAPSMPQRFILALVVHIVHERPSRHISQRELLMALNRGGRAEIQKHLLQLRQKRFLARKERRRNLTDADVYRPGSKLTGVHFESWTELSSRLFGQKSLCEKLQDRPAFGTGFLASNGMLIMGTLLRSKRPLTVREIHEYLNFFIADDGTIRRRLQRAEKHGLVKKDGPRWSITEDFWHRLEEYERDFGPNSRQIRIAQQISGERISYAIKLRDGKLTPDDEKELRQQGCIRCGRTNALHRRQVKKNLEMEHFPPRKWLNHWGYLDNYDFNWAICIRCNGLYKPYIKRTKVPALPEFIRTSFAETANKEVAVIASLEIAIKRFYRHVDAGNDEKATGSALRAFVLWAGIVDGSIPVANNKLLSPPGLTVESARLARRKNKIQARKEPARKQPAKSKRETKGRPKRI